MFVVLYRFPNRTQEEVGVIEKLRFDDETGEDMYDLHPKFRPEERVKWIPHVHIKRIPLEGMIFGIMSSYINIEGLYWGLTPSAGGVGGWGALTLTLASPIQYCGLTRCGYDLKTKQ